ncbi:MAG: helix-turn-helix transcriptional regulator [Clostridiales bacterium]|nr:helix-turn-helix transcriptional regulator [Clostridiales bacterium]
MSINDRVKQVRNALNLTQKEFGEKITLAQTYVSQIELGGRDVTEKILRILCLQFNVNEEWLRTGKGEMFVENNNILLTRLSKQYDLDEFCRILIEAICTFSQSHRDIIRSFALSIVEAADAAIASKDTTDNEAENAITFRSDRLTKLRKEKGLTMTELANEIGVFHSLISKYERGEQSPGPDVITLIADYFDVTVGYLLGRDDKAKAPLEASEETIKYALFGETEEVTDEMYEEVLRFAEFVKQKHAEKNA